MRALGWVELCCVVVLAGKKGLENVSTYRSEADRVNLDTKSGYVLLLEFTSKMALDEGSLLK